MEIIIWSLSVITVAAMALVESLGFGPSQLSQDELERRAEKGDHAAKRELKKRTLLPFWWGLVRIKVTVLVVALIGLQASLYPLWAALLISFALLLFVGVVVAMGWLARPARWLQPRIEKYVWQFVALAAPVLRLFAPRGAGSGVEMFFASKDELKQMVARDTSVLTPDEKTRLIAAMHFNGKTVADAMVPADKIATVGQSETVGPLLLDKLHKVGHNIFVVVGKNLDSIKGLLYMSDLVPLDPDIQTVKDALRSKVIYVPAGAPISNVIAASLKTGRQLFLVAKGGKTVGLITLADALEHLLGARMAKDALAAGKPEDLA